MQPRINCGIINDRKSGKRCSFQFSDVQSATINWRVTLFGRRIRRSNLVTARASPGQRSRRVSMYRSINQAPKKTQGGSLSDSGSWLPKSGSVSKYMRGMLIENRYSENLRKCLECYVFSVLSHNRGVQLRKQKFVPDQVDLDQTKN